MKSDVKIMGKRLQITRVFDAPPLHRVRMVERSRKVVADGRLLRRVDNRRHRHQSHIQTICRLAGRE